MRTSFFLRVALGVVLGFPATLTVRAAGVESPAIQYHCAGGTRLTGDSDLSTLNSVYSRKSVAVYQKFVLTRIGALLASDLGFGTNVFSGNMTGSFASDVFKEESAGVFLPAAGGRLDFAVAVALDSARAKAWHDGITKMLGRDGEKFTVEGVGGWQWKLASGPVWILPASGWLLAGRGSEFSTLQSDYLKKIQSDGHPVPALADRWLEATVNTARLDTCAPDWLRWFKAGRAKLAIKTGRDALEWTATLSYPGPVSWTWSPWLMPTNIIKNPLSSFTAGQDVGAYLNMDTNFSRLDANPLTNQFCLWAMGGLPFFNFTAWPETDPTNAIEKLSTEAVAAFNPALKKFNGIELAKTSDSHHLMLNNLRIMRPTLQPAAGRVANFLLGEVYAMPPSSKPAPESLWRQIYGHTNLVYYDWEMTGQRLQQWRMLGRMFLTRERAPTAYIMRPRQLFSKCMVELEDLKGNTVTEVTRAAPNELRVTRTGPLGFTGVELYLLSDWLATTGAPADSARPVVK